MTKKIWSALGLSSALFLTGCSDLGFQIQQLVSPAAREYVIPGEYEPVHSVIVSEHLATFRNGQDFMKALIDTDVDVWFLASNAPQVRQTGQILRQRFGLNLEQIRQVKPMPVLTETVWARDWAPVMAKHATEPGKWGLLDFFYYPDRPVDDASPQQVHSVLNQSPDYLNLPQGLSFSHFSVPVEIEGGNIMCNEAHCFVTEEVLWRIEERGETADPEAIVNQLEKHIRQEFWLVPRMPFEGTGHIDIWAKFLNNNQVIIGEISEESLTAIPEEQADTYRAVKTFLDEQATGKDIAGNVVPNALATVLQQEAPEVEILRIPMPTPGVYRGIETFRTYTNSLFVNDTVIVPRYIRGSRAERRNRDLLREQEAKVRAVYEQAGYRVKWILADNLIRDGGAWHCVSMQVPQLTP